MNRPPQRLVLTLVGLLAGLGLLHRWSGDVPTSFSITEPALLVVPLARWAGLATGWYLVAVTLAGSLARLTRLRPVLRIADAVTVPSVRRLLDTSLGLSVVAGLVAAPAAWADEGPPPTMRRLADEPPGRDKPPLDPPPTLADPPTVTPTTSSSVPHGPSPANTVLTTPSTTNPPTPGPTPTTTSTSSTSSTVPASPPGPPPAPPPKPVPQHSAEAGRSPPGPSAVGDRWPVQPGDHFWSIAERVLTAALRRAPTDAETDPYWRRLVEANRDQLADRDNPDLLFAGQVLALPPPVVPSPPSPPSEPAAPP